MLRKTHATTLLLFVSLLLLISGIIYPSNFLFSPHAERYANIVQCRMISPSSEKQKLDVAGQPEASVSIDMRAINIRVLDAVTYQPIQNAKIILWDLSTFSKPKLGAGIYFTDDKGECSISGEYLKAEHIYWLYAYKGNFETNVVDYVPVKREITFDESRKLNITLLLVPGALVELEGVPYIVQSPSAEERYMIVRVRVLGGNLANYSFIREYGSTPDAFMLGLSRKMVIVPADMPFVLETKLWFLSTEQWRISVKNEVFTISNESLPFVMPQGEFLAIKISPYSLERGVEYINSIMKRVYQEIYDARSVGFNVFDEERTMANIYQEKMEAEYLLQRARRDEEFKRVWLMLREVLGSLNYISMVIQNKYFIGKTNAVYLSAVTAVFSIVLAFFFFEKNKKKIISSILFYVVFLIVLYFVHPGAHAIIDENLLLFLESAFVSFAVVFAIVFGIPRVWKERTVEGEVSWRSAITIIFSMGKRQIKRKKIRGFFTIFSICILVLTFTSLTSFGTVIGIVSETVNATPPSEGILVRKMINGSSLLFSPLGYGDIAAISEIIPMVNVALREKNIPRADPIARLINPNAKSFHFIYGIIAISPKNESLYTNLDEIVEGKYLSDEAYGEVLISSSVAKELGVKIGDNVTLEIMDVAVSEPLTVRGLINDDEYEGLIDIDGSHFGPSRLLEDGGVRRCNSTEIMIINLRTADRIQGIIDDVARKRRIVSPQLVQLSEIVFQPSTMSNVEAGIKKIVSVHGYDVFVSSNNMITYYHFGSYIEFKGVAELLIPMIMVILNVSMVMVNSAYERSKEIRVLSMLGLNPTHIGLTFVAEATVMGMVGGSLGYLAGLGFYRLMIVFGQDLMVREKLEWWWSALGFALAILISVLSAMRPATMAVKAYTPSRIKKVKVLKEEMEKRKEEIFKVYEAREVSMPVRILTNEKEFFVSYFLDRLSDLRSGYMERTEEIEEAPEIESVRGELIKNIKFAYYFGAPEKRIGTKNVLILIKSPGEEYYRIRLKSEPITPGIPESVIDRTISFVHEILMAWVRDKKRIIGIS